MRPASPRDASGRRALGWGRRVRLILVIAGPGLIAANADNDAGGITTLSVVGASYSYQMLWALVLITFSLAITQEMGARTGAVTGKGLAALIRERYRVKITLLAMLALLIANFGTTVAEFAGVGAALELFGIPRFISVPLAAAAVWLLVIRGNYRSVERVLLVMSVVYLSYVFSAFLAGPDWGEVGRSIVTPTLRLDAGFLITLIALIGTTITPWGQFFIQSYVVDKGVSRRDFYVTRLEVYVGALITDGISLFIIVSTAATLFREGIHIEDAGQAALALRPLAGPLAEQLFGLGLLNASFLGAAVVPLSTAYAVCEAFGWEAGVSRSWEDAPIFNLLYTFAIAGAAAVVLIPALPLVQVILLSQTVNGVLLPFILVFAIRLASDRDLMGSFANGPLRNTAVWLTAAAIIAMSLALVVATVVLPLLGVDVG
ncbi:MAG: divalent metal cation transporter [Chloroflexi bacterium]|nr:divalent metal cation transporter [Chloroflexota bacterium]MBV9898731.1 divalent metal cation transporter [Chloroflexota bacterium]